MTRHRDLVATVTIAALATLVVTLVPGVRPLRTPFAAALLLALPGYALTAALFAGRVIEWPRRVLMALGLSVSVSLVVGLILNLTPFGLRGASWAVALLATTCIPCAIAARLRDDGTVLRPRSVPRLRPALTDLLFFAAAVLLLGGAVALARTPLSAKNAQGYTELWLVRSGPEAAATVRVGVASGELRPMSYRLVVRVGSRVEFERHLSMLRPGEKFTAGVRLSNAPAVPIQALLYRRDRPGVVYRVARLWPHNPS